MQTLIKTYRFFILALVLLALTQSFLNLLVPSFISRAITSYTTGTYDSLNVIWQFGLLAALILICGALLVFVQTRVSERVARDLRDQLATSISEQNFLFVQNKTPSVLLTNFTSDIDATKQFVSQAIPTLFSSVFIIIGAAAFLLSIHLRLGAAVVAIVPLIAIAIFTLFSSIRPLFLKSQQVIDRLNTVINESILGSALIRVLNAQALEYERFVKANSDARDTGMQILKTFAALIPIITLIANSAMIIMVLLGGHYIIDGNLSVGEFAAFMNYLTILIFPLFMLGFMGTMMGRAAASYGRVAEVLTASVKEVGSITPATFLGRVAVSGVQLQYETTSVLRDATFTIEPKTKTAIIGPTAAGKTQLLYLLAGLTAPTAGTITYDDVPVHEYNQAALRKELGIVFQDSALFNMTILENIRFGREVSDADVALAIDTAELRDFITSLPDGLQTIVSERGTSLSGGQKQRVMLARALAQHPKILYLDDFTARVDIRTEQKILENLNRNYPDLTLVSVTQKVATAEAYDNVILLMEGEILATGTHTSLLKQSPEYAQIVESQRSTNTYELSAE
ncbi:ABC transporter ATP-binding protein [Patescibacteria group bacterium]|nr:ABC transporter ATP-binding protein [Patescibacteria group bacterium]